MPAKLIRSIVIIFLKLTCLTACWQPLPGNEVTDTTIDFEKRLDSIASARIDSAYKAIQQQCDSARSYRLPVLIDSLQHLPADSVK